MTGHVTKFVSKMFAETTIRCAVQKWHRSVPVCSFIGIGFGKDSRSDILKMR